MKPSWMTRIGLATMGLAALALTGGCATMSADECMVADWYRLGESDARAGRTPEHLARRASDCAEAGYPADSDAWYEGFERGLTHFCTLHSGFRFGLEGSRYEHTCPSHLEDGFIEGYDLGSGIHELGSEIDRIDREMERLTREIRSERDADRPDRSRLGELRDRREDLDRQRRSLEVELATLRGMARGRGFRL